MPGYIFIIFIIVLGYSKSILDLIDSYNDLGIYNLLKGNGVETMSRKSVLVATFIMFFLISIVFLSKYLVKKLLTKFSFDSKKRNCIICRMCGKMVLAIATIGVAVYVCIDLFSIYERQKSVLQMRELLSAEKTVVHACGSIESNGIIYTYTNSYDALLNSYSNGNKVIEVDFIRTSDDRIVCGHEGASGGKWVMGIDSSNSLSEEDFLSRKYEGQFSTMSLDMLADFLLQNMDVYVVTDTKDYDELFLDYIADEYPELIDRFIIQIYHWDEYEKVRNKGYKYIIATLYNACGWEQDPWYITECSKQMDLVGITFWEYWINEREGFLDVLKNGTDIPLFVHTVNDPDSIQRDLEQGLLIYTDNVENDWIR